MPMPVRTCALALAAALSMPLAWADPAQPVDPARLKPFLPLAWKGVERLKVEAGRDMFTGKTSQAQAHYKADFNAPARLELVVRIGDEGANAARMYRDYGADYLKQDVRNDTQKSLVQGGRRFLLTSATATSMSIQTQVGGRWMVSVNCIEATEAQCVDALGRIDFAGLEKLKP
ncbi:hypothetical protein [Hydrogenophaga electricum]|uniref:Uncharacterized protein n=1 Tax=Hydrogenophaga electricum TaxID=1230953 RepID=A0ABQ6C9Y7_9BURK|nr:hypothetical protein [Hydrogenophaga electricum]GLS16910.1 hypothetical protein GCM10007935_43560 [Hydrogenophaga electricum]